MPPNRQSVASVLRTLSADDLAGFVTESKYAPLTLDASSAPAAPPSKAAAPLVVEQQQEQEQVDEVDEQKLAAVENYWDEAEEEQQDEEPEPESYWGWPSLTERADSELDAAEAEDAAVEEAEAWDAEVARREAIVAQILAEEAARAAVSTANIEANLIADAAARAKSADQPPVEIVRNTEVEEEGYWDWDAETDTQDEAATSTFSAAHIEDLLKKESVRIKVHSHSPQDEGKPQQGYWDWDTLNPDQEKQRLVQKILEDERARVLLTSNNIEANLKNDHTRSPSDMVQSEEKSSDNYWDWDGQEEKEQVRAPHADDPTHPANSYWDWTPPVSAEESKAAVIKKILADEAARQALSAAHIEDNLKSSSADSSKAEVVRNIGKSDNYWDWNGQEDENERQQEVIRAPHTQDATHPNNKYWDWSPPVSAKDSRNAVIQRILADEAARQALSASHTEETLKGETWCNAKSEVDRWYNQSPEEEIVRGEEKEEDGYWDM